MYGANFPTSDNLPELQSRKHTLNISPESILTIEDLMERFGVSFKTISRWREKGFLPSSRRIINGRRKRVVFDPLDVQKFAHDHVEVIQRAARFNQLTDAEKRGIIASANQLKTKVKTQSAILEQLAGDTGRCKETIRSILNRHDEINSDEPILTSINRSPFNQNEERAKKILDLTLEYVPSEEFNKPNAEEEIMTDMPQTQDSPGKPKIPAGLPPYIASLYSFPLLTREQERHLFRQYNFSKYKASGLRKQLDPEDPQIKQMDTIEHWHECAITVRQRIIEANLRLVVSIAKKYEGNFPALVSDGNQSLMQAIQQFDYCLGNRFSTFATKVIWRDFSRSIHNERKYHARFCTGNSAIDRVDTRGNATAIEAEHNLVRSQIQSLLTFLSDHERQIIELRFGLGKGTEPMILQEVGNELGIGKEQIRQIEAEALHKLRLAAREHKIDEPDSGRKMLPGERRRM